MIPKVKYSSHTLHLHKPSIAECYVSNDRGNYSSLAGYIIYVLLERYSWILSQQENIRHEVVCFGRGIVDREREYTEWNQMDIFGQLYRILLLRVFVTFPNISRMRTEYIWASVAQFQWLGNRSQNEIFNWFYDKTIPNFRNVVNIINYKEIICYRYLSYFTTDNENSDIVVFLDEKAKLRLVVNFICFFSSKL